MTITRRCLHFLCTLGLVLTGCAQNGAPRVLEVSHDKRVMTVGQAEESFFVSDRASHIHVKSRPLPPEEQAEEFYVRWNSRAIQEVKFECRQVKLAPGELRVKTFRPTGQTATLFRVQGDEFLKGGAVSAWRVTLWQGGDQPVAEMKSALW